jgi:hypothetical protein
MCCVAANILFFSFSFLSFWCENAKDQQTFLDDSGKAQVKSTKERLSSFHNETNPSLAWKKKEILY